MIQPGELHEALRAELRAELHGVTVAVSEIREGQKAQAREQDNFWKVHYPALNDRLGNIEKRYVDREELRDLFDLVKNSNASVQKLQRLFIRKMKESEEHTDKQMRALIQRVEELEDLQRAETWRRALWRFCGNAVLVVALGVIIEFIKQAAGW